MSVHEGEVKGRISSDSCDKYKGPRTLVVKAKNGHDSYRVIDPFALLQKSFAKVDLEGVTFCLSGIWEVDNIHGRRLLLREYSLSECESIHFYLTKIIKGLGEKGYQRLLKWAGSTEDLLRIANENHMEMCAVPGISEHKAQAIKDGLPEYLARATLVEELRDCGITEGMINRIYDHFQSHGLEKLRRNIYSLTQVPGVGFKTADRIALAKGIDRGATERIGHCFAYTIKRIAENTGDTIISRDRLVKESGRELFERGKTPEWFPETAHQIIEHFLTTGAILAAGNGIAGRSLYAAEAKIFEMVTERIGKKPEQLMSSEATDAHVALFERSLKGPLSAKQRDAIHLAAAGHQLIIVCGYAGTGKSTVAKAILDIYAKAYGEESIVCMALSGKASDRIRKTTGFSSATIASILGFKGQREDGTPYYKYDAGERMPYKVVLVDEASMVNATLMKGILEALASDATLILMGDDGQLDPIGEGQPFCDLINSGLVPTVKLTQIFRQSGNSVLTVFANDMREGQVPSNYLRPGYSDFGFCAIDIKEFQSLKRRLSKEDLDEVILENDQRILEAIAQEAHIAAACIVDPVNEFQVLTPMKKGLLGADSLNVFLQGILNPYIEGDYVDSYGTRFYKGDKVVHKKNKLKRVMAIDEYLESGWDKKTDFSVKVNNGNVGVVDTVVAHENSDNGEIYVIFPDEYVAKYRFSELGEYLEHAFAISTHKAQGNEYGQIIVPVTASQFSMLNNRWMYTSMTRAKLYGQLVGQSDVFEMACKKAHSIHRTTVLAALLAEKNTKKVAVLPIKGETSITVAATASTPVSVAA